MVCLYQEEEPPVKGQAKARKRSGKKEKATAKSAAVEAEQDSEQAEVQESDKPKKKRRGPSGYALIGEDVVDTPADRRARLKAAKNTGLRLANHVMVHENSHDHLCCPPGHIWPVETSTVPDHQDS